MTTLNDSHTSPSGISDLLLQLLIGVAAVMLGMGVWLYAHLNDTPSQQEKPRPVWLGLAEVMAQMADGRMVNVKVNLNLANDKALGELEAHKPAFQALIQDAGTHISREDIQGGDGMKRFGTAIRTTLNDYLDEQNTTHRIKDVAFEELTLLP